MEVIIAENFQAWTVAVDGQTRGPIHSSFQEAINAAKLMTDSFENEGLSGAVYLQKGAGPLKSMLWEFGRDDAQGSGAMDRMVVRYHVREFVSAKFREVVEEYRRPGLGEHASGTAVQWLAAHGIDTRNNPVADSPRTHERLTDAICATIPTERRTVEAIHAWLEAPKIKVGA